jgi:NAD+ diphosphatase
MTVMLKYTKMKLNRASNTRKDPLWLAAQKNQASMWLLTHSDNNLFCKLQEQPHILKHCQVAHLDLSESIFLGLDEADNDTAYFALDVTNIDITDIDVTQRDATALDTTDLGANPLASILDEGGFIDLRKAAVTLDNSVASLLALARALCFWHRSHGFCGRCGAQSQAIEAGHARQCPASLCGHLTYPRTDPAVIMLVQKRFADGVERCLLGRQAMWPTGVFSTLAGFVDPGESLEQAVIREVQEEVGIAVNNVSYIASQPWPFPASIMLGFIADASTETILVDKDEIDEARWFSRSELAQFGDWGDESTGYKLSRKDSISRYLIDYWQDLPC